MKKRPQLWRHPATPFVAPFALFILFLAVQDLHPLAVFYVYPVKTLAVGMLILALWRRLPPLKPSRPLASLAVGLLVFAIWTGLDPYLVRRVSAEGGFNPYAMGGGAAVAVALIIFRMIGAVLVVPVMEELFWRGWLMRFLIREDFTAEPLGRYQHFSFWTTTLAFVFVHPINQCAVALLAGIIYGAWFVRTRSLGNVMLAHGVTNLALGIHVMATGRWYFW